MNYMQLAVAVLGGLAIFVYGMGLMSDGLTQIAGENLGSRRKLSGGEVQAIPEYVHCINDAERISDIAVKSGKRGGCHTSFN